MHILKLSDVETSNPKIMKDIFSALIKDPHTRPYGMHLPRPRYDFDLPDTRVAVGEILGELWDHCCEIGLPWFNLMFVEKKTNLPGEGMWKWYEKTFHTLKGYKEFCEMHSAMCEHMLREQTVVLTLD